MIHISKLGAMLYIVTGIHLVKTDYPTFICVAIYIFFTKVNVELIIFFVICNCAALKGNKLEMSKGLLECHPLDNIFLLKYRWSSKNFKVLSIFLQLGYHKNWINSKMN